MSVPLDAEHTNTYILKPIPTNPYYPKIFQISADTGGTNLYKEKSDMIEYKPTNKIFPNRKAAKQHFGKQYFNKLWQEDKFIIVNNSNVANFDELQKNTPISSR
jgi:hypothetical protein